MIRGTLNGAKAVRSLNLDQLQTLATVVELGGFSAAARRLNLTQPAVSLQIRELESRLGLRLIERIGKRAFATAAGQDLIAHARRLAQEAELALMTMRRHREGWLGRVRLGAAATICTYLLPPVLRELRRAYPNLELVITTGRTTGILDRVVANTLDLGVVNAAAVPVDHPLVALVPLRDCPILAVLPLPEDGSAVPDQVDPAYLAGRTLIFPPQGSQAAALVAAWFAAAGVQPRPAMEINDAAALKSLVAAGLGASVLPIERTDDPFLAGQVLLRPLNPPLVRTDALVQRRDKPGDVASGLVRKALLSLADHGSAEPAPRPADPLAGTPA
jgi:DNA-binding transcriptional LysR family regulator